MRIFAAGAADRVSARLFRPGIRHIAFAHPAGIVNCRPKVELTRSPGIAGWAALSAPHEALAATNLQIIP
jgi:hypothetical protein